VLLAALASCKRSEGGAPADTPPVDPPDEPFRAVRPQPEAPRPFDPPSIQRFTLTNGADVILVERHALPMISWQILFPTGSLADPPGKEGRARLCTSLMVQGQGDTADLLADFASTVSVGSGFDLTYLYGWSLRRHLDDTLDLWARVLTMPGMTADQLAQVRARALPGLAQLRTSPTAIADHLLLRANFGAGHPFAATPTAASYGAVTVDDCRQFRDDYLHGNGAQLLVAGDITRAEVEAKFSTRLMDAQPVKPLPAVPAAMPDSAKLLLADVPGTTQSQVTLWAPGPPRQAPDYYAATVMLAIFAGDSISSRLGMDLREMMGSTYSVEGYFNYTRTEGTLIVSTPVRTDATAQAVAEMVKVATSMRDSDATADELARTRDGRISALPGRFVTADDTLGEFSTLAYYGLPFTFFKDFAANFGAVDAAAVRGAARNYLAAEQLRFIVVGDSQAVLAPLQALVTTGPLAGGTLRRVDADGNPLP
jgi:zinc protease